MNAHDYLSDDGRVMLALCSAFGLTETSTPDGPSPFKLAEWNQLAKKIAASSFKRPAGLHGEGADRVACELAISPDEGGRIVALLDRSSAQAMELENLVERGMWAITRADARYPARLRDSLRNHAPTVLFGAGEIHLLSRPGVAVIGSRNIDDPGAAFAREIGRKVARGGLAVVSGGARGTDRLAMDGALEAGGVSVGALADSLETTIRKPDVCELLSDGRLVMLTPYAPTAGFSVGAAMGRNKVIYGLSEFAVVVSSDFQTGGTWSGAVETLKHRWCPVFVREGEGVPKGNTELIKQGGVPLPERDLSLIEDLPAWFRQKHSTKPADTDLFGVALRETGPRTSK